MVSEAGPILGALPRLRGGVHGAEQVVVAGVIDFEWTLRAGDVLTFVGGIGIAASFLYRRGGNDATTASTLTSLAIEVADSKRETKESIAGIQSEIKKIGEVLINQADQNRRIIHLEDDVRELRHGEGFVRGQRGIDREYP